MLKEKITSWRNKAAHFIPAAIDAGILPLSAVEIHPTNFETHEDWLYAIRRKITEYKITGK